MQKLICEKNLTFADKNSLNSFSQFDTLPQGKREVQSRAELNMSVKKGPKSVWYCRESFGNYLGRFLLIHSHHCSRSPVWSPSTVDRGTLTSWP